MILSMELVLLVLKLCPAGCEDLQQIMILFIPVKC